MKKSEKKFIENFKKTWIYLKGAKGNLIWYIFISIVEATMSAIIPLIAAKIVLYIADGAMKQLLLTSFLVIIIDSISHASQYFKDEVFRKIHLKVFVSLQEAIARETLKLEISEIDKESSGFFINRLNNDTRNISGIFMELGYWLSYTLSNIGILITFAILNKYLFLYALITCTVIFFINKCKIHKIYEAQKELQVLGEQKTSLIGEVVRGIRDIKVLHAEEAILKQTTKQIHDSAKKEQSIKATTNVYYFIERMTRTLFDFGFLLLGCILFKNNLLAIPVFVILYNYQPRIRNLLTGLVQLLEYLKKFELAATRVYEVIDNQKFQKEKFGNTRKKKLSGHIEFKNVCFGYDEDTPILKNLSFEIEPNQKIAFVGKSGEGKTTIFNLITRLYSHQKGDIFLDGIPIEKLDCSSLRDNMSIITQNPYIFNFTIKENLQLAKKNATLKEIRNACKVACIDDFIMSLPEKYDTKVGENGVILSGGQKQRIAIARALLMKTEIILFDEATSALDNETQSEIQKAIANLRGEYTILIIAHRLSTVVDSDKIFVVHDGKIIESGLHKELKKNSKYYQSLYEKDLQN